MRKFKCKKCGTAFEVGPGDKRKSGRCFQCGEPFYLPKSRAPLYIISSIGVVVLLAAIAAMYLAPH